MKLAKHKEALRGLVVCIDPASGATSMPGYAVFHNGQLLKSGVLTINSKAPVQHRLFQLVALLKAHELDQADVLVIEKISGRLAHPYLIWSVGVTVATINPAVVLEIPTTIWKKYAKADPNYTKSDEADAICFGRSVMDLGGIKPSPSVTTGRRKTNRRRTKTTGRRANAKRPDRRTTRRGKRR